MIPNIQIKRIHYAYDQKNFLSPISAEVTFSNGMVISYTEVDDIEEISTKMQLQLSPSEEE